MPKIIMGRESSFCGRFKLMEILKFEPYILQEKKEDEKSRDRTDLFSLLPDEILIEIFGRIPMARDRSVCSMICKRWLTLQSHMRMSDMKQALESVVSTAQDIPGRSFEVISQAVAKTTVQNSLTSAHEVKWEKQPDFGDLSRCLQGKKATDIRLASIAVGTSAFGGLGKLSIKGGKGESSTKAVSDFGLSAIGISCRGLKYLSLWDCPNIGNQGLISIGNGCCQLEKLDLIKCPQLGNKGLEAIARGCPFLSTLSLDSCAMIGSTGLEAVGKNCANLLSLSLSKCPAIGDEGIGTVVQNCKFLSFLKLDKVSITDNGLALVGNNCNSLSKLILSELENLTEEGFVSLRTSSGFKIMKYLCITSCKGVSDHSLPIIGGVCKNLKAFSLVDSQTVTDDGLEGFASLCRSLEVLRLDKCPNISGSGLQSLSGNALGGLKVLHLNMCSGLLDVSLSSGSLHPSCSLLKSLSITHCEGVGNEFLKKIGSSCLSLEKLDLSGLFGVNDSGVMAFLQGNSLPLLSVNLTGCKNLTNKAVCAVARHSGSNLRSLYLDGCEKVTDMSLKVIAEKCIVLQDLDLTKCKITDAGVVALLATTGSTLKTLSLSGCKHITEKCLYIIQKTCASLFALNLQGCTKLSINALKSFKSELWRCDILSA
ncbi:hypothetical protein O6H91_Y323600 [Diphasiastrum complanatum]|nr:hypothetical protein O6H91_Y323600 [Diphasiastrum complanatum]